jgi:hypothetical protein
VSTALCLVDLRKETAPAVDVTDARSGWGGRAHGPCKRGGRDLETRTDTLRRTPSRAAPTPTLRASSEVGVYVPLHTRFSTLIHKTIGTLPLGSWNELETRHTRTHTANRGAYRLHVSHPDSPTPTRDRPDSPTGKWHLNQTVALVFGGCNRDEGFLGHLCSRASSCEM